jgi:hypothetical protein
LGADGAVDELEMDHGPAAMRIAFHAGLHAGFAADAARRIDEKVESVHNATFSIRHAQTLYSGILEMGSSTRFVSRLADFLPGQWYGTNTVSGRIVLTTCAGNSISPRRV